MSIAAERDPRSTIGDILEREEAGLTVLSSSSKSPRRRVLYVNSYSGGWSWIKQGIYPSNHLWGCVQLIQLGYEVALAGPIPDFDRARPFPHDLRLLSATRSWLGRDDILYCGHNVLFWIPLLKRLGFGQALTALLFAREPLNFAGGYTGVIGLTPAATDHARALAPRAKVAHLGWGVDMSFYPEMPYDPQWFLSCGKTHRDYRTLATATAMSQLDVQLVCPGLVRDPKWPANLTLITEGNVGVSVGALPELIRNYYRTCVAALIVLEFDPEETTAVGFTNMIEAMALARPVIVTRTGALSRELDVEKAGCGLHVPPNDPKALADAMRFLADNPAQAEAMGKQGRRLCESHYNIHRYAGALHELFESF